MLDFFAMRSVVFGSLILMAGQAAFEGRTIHFTVRDYAFEVHEPRGWTVDFGSASQIADLLIYPKGSNWRQADRIIAGRFVRKSQNETVAGFLTRDRVRFEQECPHPKQSTPRTEPIRAAFQVQYYRCSGLRDEVVAVAALPPFLLVLSLTSQESAAVKEALPVFEQILDTMKWSRRNRPQ